MSTSAKPLHIDIPVKLAEVKLAFSVAALAFEGDLPAAIFHLQLVEKDVADWNARAQIFAVFHTNAGHVTLNDEAYNAERMVATGNPYKGLVADLIKRGAKIELCGATAKVHKWGTADLLPGVKVNTDAMARCGRGLIGAPTNVSGSPESGESSRKNSSNSSSTFSSNPTITSFNS